MVPYIAVDWGTTNRRAFAVGGDGGIVDEHGDDRGVLAMSPTEFGYEFDMLRARLGDLPIVAAGMIGSNRGVRTVPYVATPAGLPDLAAGCLRLHDADVTIVPGIATAPGAAPDVMRGEEVQALGAIAAGLTPRDALICQPGTHNKWITLDDGRIAGFATSMTGELFALLRGHSVLAEMMAAPAADGAAFREGIKRGSGGDLASALFEVRASVLLGRRAAHDGASFASGVLIGAEVASRAVADRDVHVLASNDLAPLYATAVTRAGGRAIVVDARAAFVAGIHAIRSLLT